MQLPPLACVRRARRIRLVGQRQLIQFPGSGEPDERSEYVVLFQHSNPILGIQLSQLTLQSSAGHDLGLLSAQCRGSRLAFAIGKPSCFLLGRDGKGRLLFGPQTGPPFGDGDPVRVGPRRLGLSPLPENSSASHDQHGQNGD